MTNAGGIASRMDVASGDVTPTVTRLPADHPISLRVPPRTGGVTSIAAGDGAIWAAVPDIHAVIRIDPKTNRQRKIPLRYAPWGVAVDDHGAIWVTLRGRHTFNCALPDC